MNLIALPAFSDNYIWMLHDGARALVVDPGEAGPVLAALDGAHLTLAAILVTHHHADHVGGVEALRGCLQGPVYGPRRERIPEPFVPLDGGDSIEALGLRFDVIDVPGHTRGHIAYHHHGTLRPGVLFCGDTLFSGGCGRLFEGTPEQMLDSLDRLSALPGDTRVCCAHEYTLSNLRFAREVEPHNAEVSRYTDWCEKQRATGNFTLPSSIERERRVNPFLRCREPDVVESALRRGAPTPDPVPVFAAIRQWKNEFR